MPAKPLWYSKINEVIQRIQALPRPFVDRATLEFLLGVGRRRAQQILAPCIESVRTGVHVGQAAILDEPLMNCPHCQANQTRELNETYRPRVCRLPLRPVPKEVQRADGRT